MAVEDFTTYTEVDANSRLTVTSTKITSVDATGSEDVYVYRDCGASALNELEVYFRLYMASTSVAGAYAGLSIATTLGSYMDLEATSVSCHIGKVDATTYRMYLRRGQTTQGSYYTCNSNTVYYCALTRTADNDAVVLRIYTDATRATLVATINGSGYGTTTKWRYLYGFNHRNAAGSHEFDGYVENLEITGAGTPTVTTQAVDDIEATTATGNGNITSLGNATVTQHGHCWNTSTNPTTANDKTTKGTGSVGSFISSLTGLSANTLYYVRAYATNSLGTAYGDNVTFTTSTTDTPVVETKDCTALTGTTATGVGIIWNVGGSVVTEHGHCWNTSVNPTTALSTKTTNGAGFYGAFTSAITGLSASAAYYIRAYATNTQGTSYGNNVLIVAGVGGNELAGPIAVIQTRFHYVDKYGVERYVEGTAI